MVDDDVLDLQEQDDSGLPYEQRRAKDLLEVKIQRAKDRRAFAAIRDPWEKARAKRADFVRCQGSGPADLEAFLYWMKHYAWVINPSAKDPGLKVVPFILWPSQEDFARRVLELLAIAEVEGDQTALASKSRKVGITWLCLHIIYWLWRFHEADAVVGSRKQQLVDMTGSTGSLFGKLRFIREHQPAHLQVRRLRDGKTGLLDNILILQDLSTKAAIRGESTNSEFSRGDRALIEFIDEFMAVDPGIAQDVISSTESVASLLLLVGNPAKSKSHPAFDLYEKLNPRNVIEITWEGDPYRPEDFLESRIFPRGKLTRAVAEQQYCCKWGIAVEGLIFTVQIDKLLYDDDDPDFRDIAETARSVWLCFTGWDFGSGPSNLAAVWMLLDERKKLPSLWIDDAVQWNRVAAKVAAADAKRVQERYTGERIHAGDPAGRQKDSSQESWERNLQAYGVPVVCLPASANESQTTELAINRVQSWMDEGRIRLHQRARSTLGEAWLNWRWNIPAGAKLEDISRTIIEPRNDRWSHVCRAMLYGLIGALLHLSTRSDSQRPGGGKPENLTGKGSKGSIPRMIADLRV